MPVEVSGLWIYPVKSCRGINVDTAEMLSTGLARDRQWMVVDANGVFLSQRDVPSLACICASVDAERLLLSAPAMPELRVAADAPRAPLPVSVWRDQLTAIDQGDEAARWLGKFLQQEVRLVRFDSSAPRYCDPVYAGPQGARTMFADGYPVLVTNEASLASINREMAVSLPMNRFRPNLVLSGLEAFDEDYIAAIRIDSVLLRLVKPCTRCKITTTDQTTGVVGIEPLPTLSRLRLRPDLGGVAFGVNATVIEGAGEQLRVGSRVDVQWSFDIDTPAA